MVLNNLINLVLHKEGNLIDLKSYDASVIPREEIEPDESIYIMFNGEVLVTFLVEDYRISRMLTHRPVTKKFILFCTRLISECNSR